MKNLAEDEMNRTVVRCIQEIAAVLGKQTVAEFVETEEVAAILKDMGVGAAQGYFFHTPQPIDVALGPVPFGTSA
jgi:EAL domain-containing protein (putative c-di-GMP-specific phosphodiesterase class I)